MNLEQPFTIELINNSYWIPSESDKELMGEQSYNKAVVQYDVHQKTLLFKNTFVEYDSCDCGGGYPCSHEDWPYAVEFTGDENEGCRIDFEDEGMVFNGTKTSLLVYDLSKMTIGDFVYFCDFVGIKLEYNQ